MFSMTMLIRGLQKNYLHHFSSLHYVELKKKQYLHIYEGRTIVK